MDSKLITKSWKPNFKTFLVSFVFLVCSFGFSQNTSQNIFQANGISDIRVDGDQIFNISVNTLDTDKITVSSITDGEYQNDVSVISEIKGNQLFLKLEHTTLYKTPDDKRNAHKVVAATLKIELPENLKLSVKSDVGSVNVKGDFLELKLNLEQGGCNIEGYARLATIQTIDGNIFAKTNNAIIETDSRHGLVDFPNDIMGFNVWRLKTNKGNIKVEKLEQ
ncbi:MAG: hypothetical protein ED556_04250 [Winogradskyella sp.]|uniref:hypothetical protein n=1 Tax=Winogradskyella sp. TaxID=1883156 RepID=UPI000F41AD61|nr:hypothetical protein [Winogradskyella sp.]RNC88403.1 MAG: hypothetical protein ED556_04250 [Winogradskyella sp.]